MSLTEIVEGIAEYTGSAAPFRVPGLAAAAARSLHGAPDLDPDATLERKGEGGARLAAEISNGA